MKNKYKIFTLFCILCIKSTNNYESVYGNKDVYNDKKTRATRQNEIVTKTTTDKKTNIDEFKTEFCHVLKKIETESENKLQFYVLIEEKVIDKKKIAETIPIQKIIKEIKISILLVYSEANGVNINLNKLAKIAYSTLTYNYFLNNYIKTEKHEQILKKTILETQKYLPNNHETFINALINNLDLNDEIFYKTFINLFCLNYEKEQIINKMLRNYNI